MSEVKKVKNNYNKKEIKIAFIADDIKVLNKFGIEHNTTFALMLAAQKFSIKNLNVRIFLTNTPSLKIENGKVCSVFDEVLVRKKHNNHLTIIRSQIYNLESMDIIFARKDPPVDQSYLSFVQSLLLVPHFKNGLFKKQSNKNILIINSPEGILHANEKLYAFNFPELLPPTIVTSSKSEALDFLKVHKEAVIKPLFNKGGEGVFCIKIGSKHASQIINSSIRKNFKIIVQKYLPQVIQGDKRILLLNGNPIGGIVRIPRKGEFRAHISRGARYKKLSFSKNDLKICRKLRTQLIRDGLYFVGIDVIGRYLIEINVTCPANLSETAISNKKLLAEKIVQWAISTICLKM